MLFEFLFYRSANPQRKEPRMADLRVFSRRVGPWPGRLLAAVAALACGGSLLFAQMPGSVGPRQYVPPTGGPELRPAAAQQELVSQVRIVGNRTIELAKILQRTRTRVGRPYRLELIEEDDDIRGAIMACARACPNIKVEY